MKLPPKEIDNFIRALPLSLKGILLYGPDRGVIQDRLIAIKQNFLGKDITIELATTKFEYSKLKEQPFLLLEEVNNLSFGISKKIIVVYNCPAPIDLSFKEHLNKIPKDVLVVLLAEDLLLSSSLRKFFEEANNLVAIPNYSDELYTVRKIVIEFLRDNNFSFENAFVDYFSNSLKGDRTVLKNELEKILLHQGDNRHINLEKVIDIIPNSKEETIESFWLNLLLNKNLIFNGEIESLISEISVIGILRSFGNLMIRIHDLKDLISSDYLFLEASKKISPPIFFKNLSKFEAILKKLDVLQITSILEQLTTLEKETKISHSGSSNKLINFFLDNLK